MKKTYVKFWINLTYGFPENKENGSDSDGLNFRALSGPVRSKVIESFGPFIGPFKAGLLEFLIEKRNHFQMRK